MAVESFFYKRYCRPPVETEVCLILMRLCRNVSKAVTLSFTGETVA